MADREKIRAKIRALRAKTVENGCTEAEAEAAAELALRLMAEWGMDADQVDKPDWQEEEVNTQGRAGPQDIVWATIGWACHCAVAFGRNGQGRTISYLGRDPYPEVARYLHQVCHGAMERALREFRETPQYRRKRNAKTRAEARRAFLEAMALRLRIALSNLKARMGLGGGARDIEEAREELQQRYTLTTYREPKRASGSAKLDTFRAMGDRAGRDVQVNPGMAGAGHPAGLLAGK